MRVVKTSMDPGIGDLGIRDQALRRIGEAPDP